MAKRIDRLTAAEERALSLAVRSWVEYRDSLGGSPTPMQRRLLASLEAAGVEARNEMIMRSMPEIYKAAKLYPWLRRIDDTAVQSFGVLGLIRAAETFDPERRLRFATYAYYYARAYVQQGGVKAIRPIVRNHRAAEGYDADWIGREDDREDERRRDAARVVAMLDGCKLTEQERRAIHAYYGLGMEELSYGETATHLGVTKTRVGQLLNSATRKIREHVRCNPALRRAVADHFGVEPGDLPLEAA